MTIKNDNDVFELETPCFIVRENKMKELVDDAISSLNKYWKNGIIGYSFKTNNLPWIISYMKERGLYAEVVSSDEFNLALELGFPYEHIIFNGPVKGENEFKKALKYGAIVNIDSKRELKWLEECENINSKIGIRVNFDLEEMCPNETQCGSEDGRFGFSYETKEFEEALNRLKNINVKISGIHLHCSSKTRSQNIYKAIANTAIKIANEYNLDLNYIDIGGGFFGGVVNKPSFNDYFSSVFNILNSNHKTRNTNIIIEPGMALVGASVDYITRVIDIKKTKHNNFAILDGSRIHIDPLMRKTSYSYDICYFKDININNVIKKQILSGFTCMENDRFFAITDIQQLCEKDLIIFRKVGAYTMGLSPLFIQFFPIVYLENDGKISVIRRRWEVKDFNIK